MNMRVGLLIMLYSVCYTLHSYWMTGPVGGLDLYTPAFTLNPPPSTAKILKPKP